MSDWMNESWGRNETKRDRDDKNGKNSGHQSALPMETMGRNQTRQDRVNKNEKNERSSMEVAAEFAGLGIDEWVPCVMSSVLLAAQRAHEGLQRPALPVLP